LFGVNHDRQAKQVLVVRKDLRMRKGKIAAQCAHASLAVMLENMPQHTHSDGTVDRTLTYEPNTPWAAWLEGPFTKVCVSVDSERELDEVYEHAHRRGIAAVRIVDSGRTEFGGVPTKTVVAVGPGWVDEVDEVTGHLALL
jgi:PTH2 family peptidyl-tRNA hydrolase